MAAKPVSKDPTTGETNPVVIFNSIRKTRSDCNYGKVDANGKIPIRGPGPAQKELEFQIEYTSESDPMTLVVISPELKNYHDNLELVINDDRILFEIDSEKNYGFCEFELKNKIIPQFTVGSYEDGKLKLWLKKQSATEKDMHTGNENMIWVPENTLAELEAVRKKAEENLEKFYRVQLEYQNLLVSTKREKTQYEDKFASQMLLNVLEVQDNFDRALQAAKKAKGKNILLSGVEMIRKQIEGLLLNNGVTEITAVGMTFDHMKHEVCATEETSKIQEDTVIEVIQKGYMYKNKVLRLAKVKIAKPEKK